MVIGVNARFLLPNKLEGFGVYSDEVISRLVKLNPHIQFHFFFDRPFDNRYIYAPNVSGHVIGLPARHPLLYRLWFNWSVKKALTKHKCDLFYSPDGFLSLTTNVKQIGVIHDLNFEHNPKDLRKKDVKFYTKYFPQFARLAKHIITVSNYSKNDIINTYNVKPEKITTLYNGVSDVFKTIDDDAKKYVKNKYTFDNDYFLYVGALHPRKNIHRLIQAFGIFKENSSSKFKLLIVGEKAFKTTEIEEAYNKSNFKEDIIFTGYVSKNELANITASAYALVYPSYFEGFGIPVLETLKCGVPACISNKTSLPEVGGDAVLYFNPFDVNDIANSMSLIMDESIYKNLIAKTETQASLFSWDNHAKELSKIINHTVE